MLDQTNYIVKRQSKNKIYQINISQADLYCLSSRNVVNVLVTQGIQSATMLPLTFYFTNYMEITRKQVCDVLDL